MNYIFMDESGCLGFDFTKPHTSHHFVITFLFVEHERKRSLEKIVRSVFANFKKNKKIKHSGVLHATKELPET